MGSRLGLVVGLSPAAGIYYYRRLVEICARRECALNAVLAHADLPTVFKYAAAGEVEALAQYLSSFLTALARADCDIGAISAVMPHLCIDRIQELSDLRIVNLLASVREHLERRKIARLCLFGAKRVMESDLFGSLSGLDVVKLPPNSLEMVDRAYTAVAMRGCGTADDRDFFNRTAQHFIKDQRLDAIVLAGTDLSTLFEESAPLFPAVDAANIHVEVIAQKLLCPEEET